MWKDASFEGSLKQEKTLAISFCSMCNPATRAIWPTDPMVLEVSVAKKRDTQALLEGMENGPATMEKLDSSSKH